MGFYHPSYKPGGSISQQIIDQTTGSGEIGDQEASLQVTKAERLSLCLLRKVSGKLHRRRAHEAHCIIFTADERQSKTGLCDY